MTGNDLLLSILLGRDVPAGWKRERYQGCRHHHLSRWWGAADPAQPSHVQRRCHAIVELVDSEGDQLGWHLTGDDGPMQYYALRRSRGSADPLAEAVAAAEAFMAEPVAYPRLLRCSVTGQPCGDAPCLRGPRYTGCTAGGAP